MEVAGILQQLTFACILVYGIEMVLGSITLFPAFMDNQLISGLCLILRHLLSSFHGASRRCTRSIPREMKKPPRQDPYRPTGSAFSRKSP